MKSVLVLGSTGMLGSAVFKTFNRANNFHVRGINRTSIRDGKSFDASSDTTFKMIKDLEPDWIINCIGVIKPYINDQDPKSTGNASKVNSHFPHVLNQIAEQINARVIQIATDCVYSGVKGSYSEDEKHDPVDFYGKSKSQGEIASDHFMNIRCSIVGRDYRSNKSLLEWFLSQKHDASIIGYLDHFWNGVTTDAFARVCRGVIQEDLFEAGTSHLVPADKVSKAELLEYFKFKFERLDLKIQKKLTGDQIDRTLVTLDPRRNLNRWRSGGYSQIPTIMELIQDL